MADSKNLKPGWRRVKFGDVVRLSKARSQDPLADGFERYVGLEHLEPGDLRIRSWGNVADGVTFTNVFKPGQVLFGKRRAYQRKVAIADFSGVCSGDIYVLESKDASVLLPELLPFICQTDAFFDHAVGTSAGSLSPRTNWTSLADFGLALPPIEKQQSAIALLKAATDHSQSIEDAYLAAGRMLQAFKDCQLGGNGSAKTYLLGDLLLGSPDSGCSAPPKDADTGYFVLGLAALSRDGYVSGDFKPVEPTTKMLAAKLSTGDLLISRSNTVDRVGYAGIFSDDRDDVSFPDTMMRLRPNPALVRPDFLEALLQTTSAREYLMRIAAGTSASMKKINRANLLQMRLNLPSLDVQEFALGQLCELKNAVAAQKSRWEAARQFVRLIATRAIEGEV
ncbi:MAG TPA: restriction endonuclease subunit S [Pseudomonas sp.]|uniref:Restriction modification system, type I n=1 Tax=Ectopseudomonas oleovorans TaxID=301 RepID=A0A379KCE1_ECTOL|nr:restriction endonuclease subunit S [Pseudomonas oleovorans]SUD62396.1 restriction modification system, type I [Pseudomonas oleovorans]HBM62765.1 restriction endonuclease subunit S [Pseudomonas sp.]